MGQAKKEVAFEMELVLKDCETVLAEGFLPGGLAKAVVTFKVTEEEANSAMFAAAVHAKGEEFLKEQVKVVFRPIEKASRS